MVEAQREIRFLPKKEDLAMQTSEFKQMKNALRKVTEKAREEEDEKGPSLLGPNVKCPAPTKLEYTPGQPVEAICGGTQTESVGTEASVPSRLLVRKSPGRYLHPN